MPTKYWFLEKLEKFGVWCNLLSSIELILILRSTCYLEDVNY